MGGKKAGLVGSILALASPQLAAFNSLVHRSEQYTCCYTCYLQTAKEFKTGRMGNESKRETYLQWPSSSWARDTCLLGVGNISEEVWGAVANDCLKGKTGRH